MGIASVENKYLNKRHAARYQFHCSHAPSPSPINKPVLQKQVSIIVNIFYKE